MYLFRPNAEVNFATIGRPHLASSVLIHVIGEYKSNVILREDGEYVLFNGWIRKKVQHHLFDKFTRLQNISSLSWSIGQAFGGLIAFTVGHNALYEKIDSFSHRTMFFMTVCFIREKVFSALVSACSRYDHHWTYTQEEMKEGVSPSEN